MARKGILMVVVSFIAGLLASPPEVAAQDHADAHADHTHAAEPAQPETADAAGHDHSGPIVSCTEFATPPWGGLSEADRQRFEVLQQSVAGLETPEAAIAAGFRPALGDIPGMGVHYVNAPRMANGIRVEEPDHLMFSEVDGEQRLVGAAYAFVDAPYTDEPLPYDSDLAHWHDHPEFAGPDETLHMLHVWFIPSSNGPFAGLNFWLPFDAAGITPPSACWMAEPGMQELIQQVSFALVEPTGRLGRALTGRDTPAASGEPTAARRAILADLDRAAREGDMAAWMGAAERFQADLSVRERARTNVLLRALTNAQMSTAEREGQQN